MGELKGQVEIPPTLESWLSSPKKLFIGGEWADGKGSRAFTTVNPATEAPLAEVALADGEDVDRAVTAAREAFERGDWANRTIKERAEVIRLVGDLILDHRAELAVLESLDTGKPLRESYDGDIPRAAHNFHFFAGYAPQEQDHVYANGPDTHQAFREPMGVVALITPWNLPLYLETWKVAPALVMGNSVVLKPSELTPLTAAYLAELVEQAGIPGGVFNLVQGFGEGSTGEILASHQQVDAISFTGETSTGRAIMRCASAGPTRVSFELGGKGAAVVFEEAPVDLVVAESVRAAFRNQGEVCLACPRVYVAKPLYQKFVERLLAKTRILVVGDPLHTDTDMGALISEEHLSKVLGYLKGIEAPGRILAGGNKPQHATRGYFLEPTVIGGLSNDHPVTREEIFGPIVSLYPFSCEQDAIDAVNDTPYGLSASIWTRDIERASRVARGIRAGLVWVNCWFVRDLRTPFGGRKRSGIGREGGTHSLDFYSEWKSVCYKTLEGA